MTKEISSIGELIASIIVIILLLVLECVVFAALWNRWMVPWIDAPTLDFWMALKLKVLSAFIFNKASAKATITKKED